MAMGGEDYNVESLGEPRRWTVITQVLNRHLDRRVDVAKWEELWDEIEAVIHVVRIVRSASASSHPFRRPAKSEICLRP